MADAAADKFFSRHAIAPHIWRVRPYVRWTPDDPEPVRQAYAGLSTAPFMVRLARQQPGWIITRHAPPGIGAEHIYPEIRPDNPVRTGPPRRHYHGDPALAPTDLDPRHVHSPESKPIQRHVVRNKAPGDHRGVNVDVAHDHEDLAKYVFPPTPKVDRHWSHEHDRYRKPDARQLHVERRHSGTDISARHGHTSRVKDQDSSLARRVDVHPLALPLLATAETIFFALEGCLKADAILTAGGAVVSVPSVTLWHADELPAFAKRYLRGKWVVLVMDADWAANGAVLTQAFLCQTALQRMGVYNVLLAAPPADGGQKGVDDHLAAGRTLGELHVKERTPMVGLLKFAYDHRRRWDQVARNYDVLLAIAYHADSDGRLQLPLRSIARVMNVRVNRVARGLEDLVETEAITIEGNLKHRQGWFSRVFPKLLRAPKTPISRTPSSVSATTSARPDGRCIGISFSSARRNGENLNRSRRESARLGAGGIHKPT
jgi:hypothetical protein